MEFFQKIRKPLSSLGIHDPNQNIQFNKNLFFSSCSLLICITCMFIYFLVEASGFKEYADSFYSWWSMSFVLFTCLAMAVKTVHIFELIHGFEIAVQKRNLLMKITAKFKNDIHNALITLHFRSG